MKLNQLLTASVLGISLIASTSAFACEHSGGSSSNSHQESHWSFFDWCHHAIADSHRECDHDGQNTGQGNNCDRGKGNGDGYCSAGGSGSTGHTTGGGTTGGSTGGGPKG